MKGRPHQLVLLCVWIAAANQASAQVTAFNYQGRLTDGGALSSANYDIRFTLYDSAAGTNVISGPVTNSGTAVNNGLFSTTIDFGATVFTGGDRWLEVAVRGAGAGQFTALSPRQHITSSPYAVYAGGIANGGGGLTNLNASALASGAVPTARLGSGPANSSSFLRGDQSWATLGSMATENTNAWMKTNQSQPFSVSNNVSSLAASNLWTSNFYTTSTDNRWGNLAYEAGVLYFNYPNTNSPGNYLFLNKFHGGGLDGSELQIPANLIYIGPTDGGHMQIGLSSQRRVVMYLQSALPDFGAPDFHKQQSHQLGFRYGVQYPPTYTDYDLLQWNINATNYDNSARGSAHAKLIIWSPILTGTAADTALGTNIFYWDTHGWTSLQSEHKYYPQDSFGGASYVVDCFRDVHAATLHGNTSITLTNLILTNETQRIDLFLYPGPSSWSVTFPTANWIWESDSGFVQAPTTVRASTVMHVTLFANGGAAGTNIVASYKQAPYVPTGVASADSFAPTAESLAAASTTTGSAGVLQATVASLSQKVGAQEKLAAEREAEITRLEQRLARLEHLLAPPAHDGGGENAH